MLGKAEASWAINLPIRSLFRAEREGVPSSQITVLSKTVQPPIATTISKAEVYKELEQVEMQLKHFDSLIHILVYR